MTSRSASFLSRRWRRRWRRWASSSGRRHRRWLLSIFHALTARNWQPALRGMRAEVKQFAGVDVRVADKSALTYEVTDRNSMTVFLDETSTFESLKFVNPFYTGLYPDRTSIVEAVRSLLSGS